MYNGFWYHVKKYYAILRRKIYNGEAMSDQLQFIQSPAHTFTLKV